MSGDRDPEGQAGGPSREDRRRRTLVDDPALVEEGHSLRPRTSALEVVYHGEYRDSRVVHLVEHRKPQLVADVQVGCGLVEQQDLGLLGQTAGERSQLPLTRDSVPSDRFARCSMPVWASARSTASRSWAVKGRKGPRCG